MTGDPDADDLVLNCSPPGYELLGEIGRGGMGVVYRAHDLRLNREVAIKVLAAARAADSPTAQRFRAEAQISGQLQHPGIPPVHELGTLPDGRPFLAMKLVKGQTLAGLLRSDPTTRVRVATDAGSGATDSAPLGPDPPEFVQDRARLIAIFEQICQAVGYAHAHGVIHRDLKPSNIMVGAFGEVQVMDWGLAKVLPMDGAVRAADESDAELQATMAYATAIGTPPAADSATRTGAVIGTPAYMPPEQAGGEIRKLTVQSDVFGLGAILCQLLTGRPPYPSRDNNEARLQAIRGELSETFARLDACGAEADLVALCKRCLAFTPADRPLDGAAVAQEVARIRLDAEERARQAELARAQALVREGEQQRRRRVWLALAASLLLGLLASAGLGLWADQARRQALDAQEAEAAARERETLRAEGERLAKQNAEESLHQAVDAVNQYLVKVSDSPELQAHGLEGLRRDLLKTAMAYFEDFSRKRRDDPLLQAELGEAYAKLGRISTLLGANREAIDYYQQARTVFDRLVAAHPDDDRHQDDIARCLKLQGACWRDLGQLDRAETAHKDALDRWQRLAAKHGEEPAYQQKIAACFNNLGWTYQTGGQRPREAEAAYRKAVELQGPLVRAYPHVKEYRRALAQIYQNLGRLTMLTPQPQTTPEQTEAALQEAVRLRRQLARDDPAIPGYQNDLANSQVALAYFYQQTRQPERSLALQQEALKIRRRLANEHPLVPLYQEGLANINHTLGWLHQTTKRHAEARAAYDESIRIYERLQRDYPDANADTPVALAQVYHELGILMSASDPAASEAAYQSALAIRTKLVRERGPPAAIKDGLAWTYNNLANLYDDADRKDEAAAAREQALRLREELVREHPEGLGYVAGLAASYQARGDDLARAGKVDAALPWYANAIARAQEVVTGRPLDSDAPSTLVLALWRRADALTQLARHAEALADWDRALVVDTGERRQALRVKRFVTLARLKRTAEATAEVDALARGKEVPADLLADLARICALASLAGEDQKVQEAQRERAVALLRQAMTQGLKNTAALQRDPDLVSLRQRADFQKLLAELEARPKVKR